MTSKPHDIIDDITHLRRNRRYLVYVFLLSAWPLLLAYGSQILAHLHPCHLCLLQRYPYMAIILLSAVSVGFAKKHRNVALSVLFICAIIFMIDAGIAIYHVGVEQHWISGPVSCTSSPMGDLSLEQLRAQIMAAPVVACDSPVILLFGISMAAANFAYALFCVGASFYMLRKIWRLHR